MCIRDSKAGELGLQVDQLWRGPFRKQFGQRAEGPGLMDCTSAMPPAGAGQVQCAEQTAHHDVAGILVPASSSALRAGRLGGQGAPDLMTDRVAAANASAVDLR